MAFLDEAITWRRQLHAEPELLFELPRTAAFVSEKLRSFGLDEVVTGLGQTGVVGVLRGARPGPVIGLRADMDALPVMEATGLPYASGFSGQMHACGHDGHTAMLLLAASRLAEARDFAGTAVFIFQPAEENGGDGARSMIQDGLMDRFGIEEVYGLHCMPGLPEGHFATRCGGFMAAADILRIRILGQGGHAARPELSVDPLLVASHIHVALQSIVSRNVDPIASAVISITQMEASNNEGVIAPEAYMAGTVRTVDETVRDLCEARIRTLAEYVARAHSAHAEVDYIRDCPVTVNHPDGVTRAVAAASRVGPIDADAHPVMITEDFSVMLRERPGAFVFLGQGEGPGLHSPLFDFNDRILGTGADYWVSLIKR